MACFVTIEANNVAEIFADLTSLDSVDINSWNMEISSLHLVFPVLLFLFFLRLCGKVCGVSSIALFFFQDCTEKSELWEC